MPNGAVCAGSLEYSCNISPLAELAQAQILHNRKASQIERSPLLGRKEGGSPNHCKNDLGQVLKVAAQNGTLHRNTLAVSRRFSLIPILTHCFLVACQLVMARIPLKPTQIQEAR